MGMSKELDYLDDLLGNMPLTLVERTIIECIKEKLQRLESIDNANPSEALKCVDKLEQVIEEITISNADLRNTLKASVSLAVIKQALIKAREQDFNYKNIVLPFFNELVELLGVNDTDEMLGKIKEQKKALEIIKEKNVNVEFLKHCKFDLETYNADYYTINLTQKEIDLLKEVLDNGTD